MPDFRVATFNALNLVSQGRKYYSRPAYGPEEFQEKTQWMGRRLDEMEADIVGFQEIFHKDALKAALVKSQRFLDVEPVVLATDEMQDPARTPAVALVSRFPLDGQPESIAEIPVDARITAPPNATLADSDTADEDELVSVPVTTFSRPVLKARIKFNDDVIVTLFVAHLKSKRPTLLENESRENPIHRTVGIARSLIRRAAEAAGLRSLVVSEIKDNRQPAIVVGDVNDGTLAVTTQMIAGEPPFFRLPTDRKEPFWDVLLYTAQQLQVRESTRDTYFTHIFNGSYEALDHIMVSEEFYSRNPDRVGEVDYVRVFNDHIIDEMQSFDEIPRTRSDHGQVVAKILLRPSD